MPDLNDVLERLMTDPGFRQQLKDDPAVALEGYHLDEGELELLSAQIDEGSGVSGSVEQRTSKSALAGLLGLFGGGGAQGQYQESDLNFAGRQLEDDGSGADIAGDSDGLNELAVKGSGASEDIAGTLGTDGDGTEAPGLPKGPFVADSFSFGSTQDSAGLRSDGELAQAVSDESSKDILEDEAIPGEQQGQSDIYEFPGQYAQSFDGHHAQSDDGVDRMSPGGDVEAAQYGPKFGDIRGESQGDGSVMEVSGLKMESEVIEAEGDLGFVGQHLEHDESGAELENVSLTYQRIDVEADSDEIAIEDSAGSEGDEFGRVKTQFAWDADDEPAAGIEHTDNWDQPSEMAEVGEGSEEGTMEPHEFTLSKTTESAPPSQAGEDGTILIHDPYYPASGEFDGEHLVTSARHGDEDPLVEDIAGTQGSEPNQPIVIGRMYNGEDSSPEEPPSR